MSCIVILEIRARPGMLDEMKEVLREMLPDTRAFAGCNSLQVSADTEDASSLVFHEHWDSRAHYEKYLAWRGNTELAARLGALIDGRPRLRFLEQLDL